MEGVLGDTGVYMALRKNYFETKPISQLRRGEQVLSWRLGDDSGTGYYGRGYGASNVAEVLSEVYKGRLVQVELEYGGTILGTPELRVRKERGFVELGELRPRDCLLTVERGWPSKPCCFQLVKKVRRVPRFRSGHFTVWNIKLSHNHAFAADHFDVGSL